MTIRINSFEIAKGLSEAVDKWLEDNSLELLDTAAYADHMQHSAQPMLVVTARSK